MPIATPETTLLLELAHGFCHRCEMRIVVDVASDRLRDEVVELLERAGHTLERGSALTCPAFDRALDHDTLYRELFMMPPDDPCLGLDIPDPF